MGWAARQKKISESQKPMDDETFQKELKAILGDKVNLKLAWQANHFILFTTVKNTKLVQSEIFFQLNNKIVPVADIFSEMDLKFQDLSKNLLPYITNGNGHALKILLGKPLKVTKKFVTFMKKEKRALARA